MIQKPFKKSTIIRILMFWMLALTDKETTSKLNISPFLELYKYFLSLMDTFVTPSYELSRNCLSIFFFPLHFNTGCDKNFHKKCAYKIPNDCTRYWTETGMTPPTPGGGTPWSGRPLWIDKAIHSRPQVPHTFFVHSFKKPTACQKCKKLVSSHKPALDNLQPILLYVTTRSWKKNS